MDFGIGTVLAVVGGAVLSFLGVKGALKVDDKVEDSKRGSMKLALWARENGLNVLEDLLENFTVGAKVETLSSIRQLIDLIRDPVRSQEALDKFLKVQLTNRLSTVEGQKQILDQVEAILGLVIDRTALVKAPTALGEIKGE